MVLWLVGFTSLPIGCSSWQKRVQRVGWGEGVAWGQGVGWRSGVS